MALPNLSALPTAGFLRPDDPNDPRPWWERNPLEPKREEEPAKEEEEEEEPAKVEEEEEPAEEPEEEEPAVEEEESVEESEEELEEQPVDDAAPCPALCPGRDACRSPCNAAPIELGISLYRLLFPHYRNLDCAQAADMEFPDEDGQRFNLAAKNRFHPDLRLFNLIEFGQSPIVAPTPGKPFVTFLEHTGRRDRRGMEIELYGSSRAFRYAMEDVAQKNMTVRLVLDEDPEPGLDEDGEDGAWWGATVASFDVTVSRLDAAPESPQARVNNTVVQAVWYWYHVYRERSADDCPRVRRPPDEPQGWQFVPVVDPDRVGDVRNCESVALLPALELRAEARVEGAWAALAGSTTNR